MITYDMQDDNTIVSILDSLSTESVDGLDDKTEKIYIGLFTPKKGNIINSIIVKRTGYNYSHAGISLDDKLAIIYDIADLNGLRNIKVKNINEDRYIDFYSFKVSIKQKMLAKNLLEEFSKRSSDGQIKYNFKALFAILFGFTKTSYDKVKMSRDYILRSDTYICSAFVAGILAAVSNTIKNYFKTNQIKLDAISPGELTQFPGVQFEFSFNCKTKKREEYKE